MAGEVTEIRGIGGARAEALAGMGIETAEDLAAADPDDIAVAIASVTREVAVAWIDEALAHSSPREEAISTQVQQRERAVGPAQPGRPDRTREEPGEEVDVVSPKTDEVTLDLLADLYEEASWRGVVQWRCLLCPWDTLRGEQDIREHVARRHVLGAQEAEARGPASEILVARR